MKRKHDQKEKKIAEEEKATINTNKNEKQTQQGRKGGEERRIVRMWHKGAILNHISPSGLRILVRKKGKLGWGSILQRAQDGPQESGEQRKQFFGGG